MSKKNGPRQDPIQRQAAANNSKKFYGTARVKNTMGRGLFEPIDAKMQANKDPTEATMERECEFVNKKEKAKRHMLHNHKIYHDVVKTSWRLQCLLPRECSNFFLCQIFTTPPPLCA